MSNERQGDTVVLPVATLKHWRTLVDDNPRDLAPRMDAYIERSEEPAAPGDAYYLRANYAGKADDTLTFFNVTPGTVPTLQRAGQQNAEAGQPPHQLRVIKERDELRDKLAALAAFAGGKIYCGLGVAEQQRLSRQAVAMQEYLNCLNERIARF